MANSQKGQANSAKDKQMAARLKAEGVERTTGRCAICYKLIANGAATYTHYCRHAWGSVEDEKAGK